VFPHFRFVFIIITFFLRIIISTYKYIVQKYQVVTFTETTSPLDQFDIIDLISLDAPIFGNIHISLTNIGLYLTIGAFLALSLNLLATNNNKIISNK
jgi:hypothetical protein